MLVLVATWLLGAPTWLDPQPSAAMSNVERRMLERRRTATSEFGLELGWTRELDWTREPARIRVYVTGPLDVQRSVQCALERSRIKSAGYLIKSGGKT